MEGSPKANRKVEGSATDVAKVEKHEESCVAKEASTLLVDDADYVNVNVEVTGIHGDVEMSGLEAVGEGDLGQGLGECLHRIARLEKELSQLRADVEKMKTQD